jgi:heterodisulfide reductase subunit A2
MGQDVLSTDAVVIGGGIAGIQSALDLADQGFKVTIIEKSPTIGGKMITLSKVFPTLDCASCITTPKMSSTAHHPNISILAYSEVDSIEKRGSGFSINLTKKPRYIVEKDCTGCRSCEYACPLDLNHWFDSNLGVRRTIYVPFENAIPQIAIRDPETCLGRAPCQQACPAGVDAKGYIGFIAAGQYPDAIANIRRTMPFPGVCGRVCTHPCESECQRNSVDQPLAIRSLKRFAADWELNSGREKASPLKITRAGRVAVVGSGPSGLACAYDLTKKGYGVTIFEAAAEPGGLLRYGIPAFRLPRNVLNNEIDYIRELGVTIQVNRKVNNVDELFNQGFAALFLATGAWASRRMGIAGENATGVMDALDFLKKANSGEKVTLGPRVAVIGGGNSAVDAARVAKRLGAAAVTLIYRRSRDEMPAVKEEIEEAEEEQVIFQLLANPLEILRQDGRVSGLRCIRMELGEPDSSGRRRAQPINGTEFEISADNVIFAIGQAVERSGLLEGFRLSEQGALQVDAVTLQTSREGVFGGGDLTSGPADVIQAVSAGKEAAVSIERFLEGQDLRRSRRVKSPPVHIPPDPQTEKKPRQAVTRLEPLQRAQSFSEVESGYSESSARAEAGRCLSCLCGNCERVCPTNAVDFSQEALKMNIQARTVIMSTGFELTALEAKKEYGGGTVPNVISPLQMERLLVPNGPYGRVVRPSDSKVPGSIAYVQCAGSRDKSLGVTYCSRVCCMYAIKQAMLLSGSLPMADITIYYMDIRAFGKGYEEFFQNAKAMGIKFVKGKVARITEGQNQSPVVRVELIEDGGPVEEQQHDLVVLSLGMKPAWQPDGQYLVTAAPDGFLNCPGGPLAAALTDCEGIFVAGTAAGPKDIVDSIIEGGSAALQASNYLKSQAPISSPANDRI